VKSVQEKRLEALSVEYAARVHHRYATAFATLLFAQLDGDSDASSTGENELLPPPIDVFVLRDRLLATRAAASPPLQLSRTQTALAMQTLDSLRRALMLPTNTSTINDDDDDNDDDARHMAAERCSHAARLLLLLLDAVPSLSKKHSGIQNDDNDGFAEDFDDDDDDDEQENHDATDDDDDDDKLRSLALSRMQSADATLIDADVSDIDLVTRLGSFYVRHGLYRQLCALLGPLFAALFDMPTTFLDMTALDGAAPSLVDIVALLSGATFERVRAALMSSSGAGEDDDVAHRRLRLVATERAVPSRLAWQRVDAIAEPCSEPLLRLWCSMLHQQRLNGQVFVFERPTGLLSLRGVCAQLAALRNGTAFDAYASYFVATSLRTAAAVVEWRSIEPRIAPLQQRWQTLVKQRALRPDAVDVSFGQGPALFRARRLLSQARLAMLVGLAGALSHFQTKHTRTF
jgi:hypothetical protein